MDCPFCGVSDTKVTDSRLVQEANSVRRRRVCASCNERFTTYERIEYVMPRVVKRDASRAMFDERKLRDGMMRALEKRPVSTEQVEQALNKVLNHIRATSDKEVATSEIGECVMQALRELDDVAYVRFASVYRRFRDLESFRDEIDKMLKVSEK